MTAYMARIVSISGQTTTLICQATSITFISHAGYAVMKTGPSKAGKAKSMTAVQSKHYTDLEADPVKLVTTLCGGNIMKDGADPVLKEDHEYPDWLWTLRTERGHVPLEELDQETKEYWKRIRKMDIKRTRLLQKTRSKWSVY